MKALIALFATVSLFPTVAVAQQAAAVEAPADVSITTCSVSGDASSPSVSFSLSGPSAIGGISGGVIAGIMTTPSIDGGPPMVTAMAIKTKGAGANDRVAKPNVKHPELMRAHAPGNDGSKDAIKTRGCSGPERLAAPTGKPVSTPGGQVIGNRGVITPQATCSISADGSTIGVSGLPLPSVSKVSVQDLHFVSSSDAMVAAAGPGGGPRVLSRCIGADGAPSEVTMLLLPAVQK